jgi:hypothetical protein
MAKNSNKGRLMFCTEGESEEASRDKKPIFVRASAWLMIVFLALPPGSFAQQSGKAAFNQRGGNGEVARPSSLFGNSVISASWTKERQQ